MEWMNFSDLTTLKIGGPVKDVLTAETEEELINHIQGIRQKRIPYLVIGGGSNLLVADEGFEGVVIRNQINGKHVLDNKLISGSGEILQDIVDFANEQGLLGFESLAGIPGTLGGAIYGNAGAYGQTISDHLVSARIFREGDFLPSDITKDDCHFEYRNSSFKKNEQPCDKITGNTQLEGCSYCKETLRQAAGYCSNKSIVLGATFQLARGESEKLIETSLEIIKKREAKYPPGIKCPGSFFKNIIASSLPEDILAKIPEEKIVYGKIPAGTLLEMVGAKGDFLREIEIAPYHANLFINKGGGTAKDFYILAKKYFDKVNEKFGIKLEPEVQLINLNPF